MSPPPLNRAQRRALDKPTKKQTAERAVFKRLSKSAQSKCDRQNAKIRKRQSLPLGHPDNVARIALVFDHVESVLAELCSTGELDAMPDGTLLFRDPIEGVYSPLGPSFESMCETYSKLARTFGWTDQTSGARQLAKRIELQMPLFQRDIDAARVSFAWMRERSLEITPDQFHAEAVEVQIRNELQDIKLAP